MAFVIVAAVQMSCSDKVSENIDKAERLVRDAASKGAKIILLPERPWDMKEVVREILDCRNKGKRHYIVIVAEGAGSATEIAKQIEEATEIESRPTILGHLQRGGSPTLRDRTMASLMGIHAIECIQQRKLNRLVCYRDGHITDVDIEEGLSVKKSISMEDVERSSLLS